MFITKALGGENGYNTMESEILVFHRKSQPVNALVAFIFKGFKKQYP